MSIVRTQSNTNPTLGTPSQDCIFNSALAGGELLICTPRSNGGDDDTFSVSDNVNGAWSQAVFTFDGTSECAAIWYKENSAAAAAGACTVTATSTTWGGGITLNIAAYSGMLTASALDKTQHADAQSGTNCDSGATAATTQASELLIGVTVIPGPTDTNNQGALDTGTFVQNAGRVILTEGIVSSTGAYHAGCVLGASHAYGCAIATFKAAGGGGGGGVVIARVVSEIILV